jgi:transposase
MKNSKRVLVRLGRKDRPLIVAMLRRGRESARVLRRASILQQRDQGQKFTPIAVNRGVVPKTVRTIARRFKEEGLESALNEKPRPGKARVVDSKQSQRSLGRSRIPSLGH